MKRFFLLIVVAVLIVKTSTAANYYWRATAVNNLYTNVGNWEVSPGGAISPGVAPSSNDSVFFPVTSNISTINLNGGNCGVFTVSAPTTFTFTGTGNFYGDLLANGNARFSATVNLINNTIKNINLTSVPNTTTAFFIGGTLNCNTGTINLAHNLYHNGTITIRHSVTTTVFNSNGYDIVSANFNVGSYYPPASVSLNINFDGSIIETNTLRFANARLTKSLIGVKATIKSNLRVYSAPGSTPLNFSFLKLDNVSTISINTTNESGSPTVALNLDSLVVNTKSVTGGRINFTTTDFIIEQPVSVNAGGSYSFHNLVTPPFCPGNSVFYGPSTINTLSPVSNTTINFSGMNFTGSGFTASSSNNLGNNYGPAIIWGAALSGQTFHWVGDSGDWNDPTKWSLLGSGGAAQTTGGCIPTFSDSVVFDVNSFTAVGQLVNTSTSTAMCKSISVIDPGNEGSFNSNINIAGNADFSGANAVNTITLLGSGSHFLNSGNTLVYSGNIVFRMEGVYTLTSRLFTSGVWLHYSGSFVSDGYQINALAWRSSRLNTNYAPRNINIENSEIDLNGSGGAVTSWADWYFSHADLNSLLASNSTIRINRANGNVVFRRDGTPALANPTFNDLIYTATTGTAALTTSYTYNRFAFNNIVFNSSANNTSIQYPYDVDTLHLTAGKNYTFRSGYIYNINHINTISNACDELAVVSSSGASPTIFHKAIPPFSGNNLMINGINASGATLNVVGGVDNGNLTNVNLTPAPGRDLYWVGNSGSWNDGSKWSIGVTGGNPAITNPSGCIPRPIDNVFFDTNSFTITGQNVILNVDGNCKDITWTSDAASFSPNFSGASGVNLNIYGSLEFNNGMTHNHTGNIFFRGKDTTAFSQTIKTDSVIVRSNITTLGGGRYDFMSSFIQSGAWRNVTFNSGYLVTNGHPITAGTFHGSNLSLNNRLNIDNTNFTIYTAYGGGGGFVVGGILSNNFTAVNTNVTMTAGAGSFSLTSGTSDTIPFGNIIYDKSTNVIGTNNNFSFNKIDCRGTSSSIGGGGEIMIDTLIYRQSSSNSIASGKLLTVLDTLIADGTPCIPITLRSGTPTFSASVKSGSCNFDIQFGNVQDLSADISSGCVAANYRVFGNDAGGNLNLNFVPPPSTNQLGVDTIVYCTDAPYEILTDGFGNAPAQYLWNTGDTTKTIDVDTSGIYYVQVTYIAGCVASDTLMVTVIDTVAPVITCSLDSMVGLDNSCQYTLADFTDSVAVDDCTPDSSLILTQNPIAGTIFNGESIQTIWVYAEDNYGNIDSCSFQLTLLDSINPIITCNDTTIYIDGIGQYIIDTSYVLNNAADNCGIDSIWTNDTLFTCANIGANIATIYVRDVNGNVDSCAPTVTVLDTLKPVIVCKDTTIYLNGSGQYIIDTSYVFANGTDNCGIDSIWTIDTLYNCSTIGLNTATIYIRDVNGNLDSCTSTITVLDTLNPVVSCKDTIVYLSALGTISIDTSYVYVNSVDNCGVDSIWINNMSFTCVDTGVNSVPVYVRDVNGNTDSCIASVTVLDTISPVISCPGNIIVCQGTVVNWVVPTPTDNCGILSLTSNFTPGSIMPIGVNSVTYIATDLSGNIDSCSFTVTVNENADLTDFHIAKVRSCEDTVYNTLSFMVSSGSFPVNYWFYNTTDTLISGVVNTLDSVFYFDSLTLPHGTYHMVINNPDGCNTDSVIQIDNSVEPLLVDSLWAPSYVCYGDSGSIYVRVKDGVGPYDYYLFNSNGDTVNFVQATTDTVVVFNNLPPDNYTMDVVDFGQVDWHHQIGGSLRERGSMFQDSSGNVFLIGGTESPEYTLGTPQGGIDGFLIKIDKDGHIKWRKRYGTSGLDYLINMKELSNGDFALLGYKKGFFISQLYTNHDCDVWLLRIDSNGNVLRDTTYGGTIYDQPRDIVELANGDLVIVGGSRSNNGDFVGNHGGLEDGFIMRTDANLNLQWTRLVGSTGQDGLSSINLLPNGELLSIGWCGGNNGDVSGFHGGGMDGWLVRFDQNGNILNQNAFGGSAYDYLVYNKTDENYIYSMGLTASSNGDIAFPGYGNYDGLAIRFNILADSIDKVYKVGTPQYDEINSFVPTNDGGFYTAGNITNASLDGWLAKFDSTGALENSQIIGGTSGNSYYGSQYEGLSTILNSNDGFYLVSGSYHSPNGTFNGNHGLEDVLAFKLGVKYCGIVSVTIPEIPQIHDTVNRIICQGSTSNIGPNIYNSTGTYIDTLVSALSCDSIVTLNLQVDSFVTQTVDTMICNGQTMTLHGNNYLVQGVYNDTVTNSNGCDSIQYTLNLFVDTVGPIASCKDTIVYLNNLGSVAIDSSYINIGSSDNCTVLSMTLSKSSFSCIDTGLNIVTLYVTDNNNNIDSCSATVTVLDTLNPIIVCSDTLVYLNTSGQVTIDTSFIFTSASDNCSVDSVWTNDTLFTCANTGINIATIYARDVNGNIDSCQSQVTVLDSLNPIVVCKDTTIYLNTSGQYSIDTSYIHVSNNDNCGVDSVWTNDTLFTCANIGVNTANLYVRDVNGNIDSCIANVTVLDTLSPTVNCQDTTVYLSSAGTYTIDTSYVLANLSDNCGVDTVWLNPINFTCADTGINTVTIYARDVNNNIDSCIATITVLDTVNPTVSCQSATVYLDTNGQFIIDTSYVYSSSFAGCGLDSIWIADSVFDCSRIGVNTISVYARDVNGNIDSCQAQVMVLDTVTPAITCGSTLYDTVSNSCEYIVPDFRASTQPIDNCTDSINFQITQTPTPGTVITVQDQQIQNITITVADTNGNQTVCMFDVELICKDKFQIPEFISPNGDGKNDRWIITGIEDYPNNAVKIFNRYGALVYEKTGYQNTWDGTANADYIFQAGITDNILPSGTYFFRLELNTRNENSEVYNGIIHIQK